MISIGMPLFNAERYAEQAIESVLNQTETDLELVISDNASTDATPSICERYAARDSRVRVVRNATNLGAAPNFNRTFREARGKYFKWAAYDDVLAPEFLERCVAVLESDPGAVLCFTRVQPINERGEPSGTNPDDLSEIESVDTRARFRWLIDDHHNCLPVFGLIRSEVLARSRLIDPYVGSDRMLLSELSLHGRFHVVPEVLFYHRAHRNRSTKSIPLRERAVWFDASRSGKFSLTYWRYLREYGRSVAGAPLPLSEKAGCCVDLVRWTGSHRRELVKDVLFAARYYSSSTGRRRRSM